MALAGGDSAGGVTACGVGDVACGIGDVMEGGDVVIAGAPGAALGRSCEAGVRVCGGSTSRPGMFTVYTSGTAPMEGGDAGAGRRVRC
jgi:hypothetical protein